MNESMPPGGGEFRAQQAKANDEDWLGCRLSTRLFDDLLDETGGHSREECRSRYDNFGPFRGLPAKPPWLGDEAWLAHGVNREPQRADEVDPQLAEQDDDVDCWESLFAGFLLIAGLVILGFAGYYLAHHIWWHH
jgi:hypothetical protein